MKIQWIDLFGLCFLEGIVTAIILEAEIRCHLSMTTLWATPIINMIFAKIWWDAVDAANKAKPHPGEER